MYLQIEPPDDLKHMICFFYVMEYGSADPPLQPLLPSGTEIMGWQYAGKWFVRIPRPGYTGFDELILPDYYTVGQQLTSYWLTALDKKTAIMGATLQPGTLWQYFRRPAASFTQRVTETHTLFPQDVVQLALHRFRKSVDTDGRLGVLIDFYRQVNGQIKWERSLVDEAMALIYRSKGALTVAGICQSLRINERYLQRHFKMRIGITVQQYIGMMRFNNVFSAVHLTREPHSMEVMALLYNYYDLSHFHKAYKRYFGVAPSTFELDKFKCLMELVSDKPYNLTVQNQYLNDSD